MLSERLKKIKKKYKETIAMGCTTGKMPKQKISSKEIQEMKDAREAYLSCIKASQSNMYWS